MVQPANMPPDPVNLVSPPLCLSRYNGNQDAQGLLPYSGHSFATIPFWLAGIILPNLYSQWNIRAAANTLPNRSSKGPVWDHGFVCLPPDIPLPSPPKCPCWEHHAGLRSRLLFWDYSSILHHNSWMEGPHQWAYTDPALWFEGNGFIKNCRTNKASGLLVSSLYFWKLMIYCSFQSFFYFIIQASGKR